MASAITGINRSITAILESAGPKTFFVQRYFSGGLDVSDGSDEMSPWRRMPWITIDEAELIRRLPAIRDINIGEYSRRAGCLRERQPHERGHRGIQPVLEPGQRRGHPGRPEFHAARVCRRLPRRDHQRQARRGALSRAGGDRKDDQDFRSAVYRPRNARRGRLHVQQRGRATAGDPSYGLYQGGRLRQGLDGNRGGPHRAGHDARGPGPGDRGAPKPARAPARPNRTTSRS